MRPVLEPFYDHGNLCSELEVVSPLLKALELADGLIDRMIVDRSHLAESTSLSIDSEHLPPTPKELLSDVVRVVNILELDKADQFEVARERLTTVDTAAPIVHVQVLAVMVVVIFLHVRVDGEEFTIDCNITTRSW